MRSATPGPYRSVLIHEYVTGGGLTGQAWCVELMAEARAMRQALARDLAAIDGLQVVLTLDDRLEDEPGPWQIIRVPPGKEYESVRTGLDQVDSAIVVAPETEGLLTERVSWLQSHRTCRSLVGTSAAVELAGDKWQMAHHLDRAGIQAPPTTAIFALDDLPTPDEFPYPAVLKPFDGVGSQRTFFLSDPSDLPAAAGAELPALLQTYVPGTPMSASFLVDDQGQSTLVGVGRQRVGIEQGRFHYRGGILPAGSVEMAAEPARAIASIPGLRGWIGVDFIWNEASAQAYILEINPRLTTSFVGWCHHLPAGTLGRIWLGMESLEDAEPHELARQLHTQPPLAFNLDGTCHPAEDHPRDI